MRGVDEDNDKDDDDDDDDDIENGGESLGPSSTYPQFKLLPRMITLAVF